MTDKVAPTSAPADGRIEFGGLHGEAALAAVRGDASGAVTCWAAEAFHLQADGIELLSRRGQPVCLAEAR